VMVYVRSERLKPSTARIAPLRGGVWLLSHLYSAVSKTPPR
jgi:hypothetical protein